MQYMMMVVVGYTRTRVGKLLSKPRQCKTGGIDPLVKSGSTNHISDEVIRIAPIRLSSKLKCTVQATNPRRKISGIDHNSLGETGGTGSDPMIPHGRCGGTGHDSLG